MSSPPVLPVLVVALVGLMGSLAAAAQDPPSEWKGFRDGLPKEESGATPPAFLDPELFNIGYGPMRSRSLAIFPSMRMGAMPDPPSYLPRGHWEFRETFEWSRVWVDIPGSYFLDFDTWSSGHSVAYGLSNRTQLELGVVQSGWSRGRIDGFVRGFHRTFGLDQGGRDVAQKGEFVFQVRNPANGEKVVVEETEQDAVTEQLVFSIHTVLTPGDDVLPAVSWTVTAKGNLRDSELVSGNGVEFGTSLSLSKQLGDFHAYATMSFSWYGNEAFYGIGFKPFTVTVVSAVEWRVLSGFSLILQHQWTQGAVENLGAFSQPSYEINAGMKIQISENSMLEVSVVENIVNFDNSPDLGLHTGLTIQF